MNPLSSGVRQGLFDGMTKALADEAVKAVVITGLNRAFIFFNKLTYVVVSVITAMKNKKQRFSNQGICFLL